MNLESFEDEFTKLSMSPHAKRVLITYGVSAIPGALIGGTLPLSAKDKKDLKSEVKARFMNAMGGGLFTSATIGTLANDPKDLVKTVRDAANFVQYSIPRAAKKAARPLYNMSSKAKLKKIEKLDKAEIPEKIQKQVNDQIDKIFKNRWKGWEK